MLCAWFVLQAFQQGKAEEDECWFVSHPGLATKRLSLDDALMICLMYTQY
jgi:hypothetical protein